MLSFGRLLFCLLIASIPVNCDDNLVVRTNSGQVRGITLKTLLNKREYQAFRGIPYAQPPVGNLRFKAPVPVSPWRGTLQATDYGNSCLVIYQSQLFPLNNTQSEDCLYLNVFTPVTKKNKIFENKPVMLFIHGGAFTEGDGTNGFYGADFIVEDDTVLVTINYRLGPWGFASFDLKDYTGNMGFKDQQLALEWVYRNIRYFGGDPNLITVFGESAGGAAVHYQVLNRKSRKMIKRAAAMSGSALTSFGHYEPNNHIELFKTIFDLDPKATGKDVLKFMMTAPTELILEKTPVIYLERSLVGCYFTAVVEDPRKADNPFLLRGPRHIYANENVNVDTMFGVTSAENIVLFNPADPYGWIDLMKNNYAVIGLPFSGLTLSPESPEYQEAAKKIYEYYFGTGPLEPNVENLNKYLQMCTDMNFVYPAYESMRLHSLSAKTFCYENNLDLNLNSVKISNNYTYIEGTAHFEDLQYLFLSDKYARLYQNILANPTDPKNKKTLAALEFVPKLFTDYAKRGWPLNCGRFTCLCDACVEITDDGIQPTFGLRSKTMKFWDSIYNSVRQWIVNPF